MSLVKKRYLLRIFTVSIMSIFLHTGAWAQPDPGDPSPDDPGDPGGDPDLPIDTNILVLVAAGVGYGLKKTYDFKQKLKRKNESTQAAVANYEDFVK